MVLLAAATAAFAQTDATDDRYSEVTLKSGAKLKGRIVEYVQDSHLLLVKDSGDTLSIQLNDVAVIHGKKRVNSAFTTSFGETGPQKGYYGSVYVDYTTGNQFASGGKIGLSTVQGYQLTPYLMLGAGAEVRWGKGADDKGQTAVVGFADARLFFTRTSITPYLDIRGGYGLTDHTKGYISPTIGCRFSFKQGSPLAAHMQLGLTWCQVKRYDAYESGALFTVRAGFEF